MPPGSETGKDLRFEILNKYTKYIGTKHHLEFKRVGWGVKRLKCKMLMGFRLGEPRLHRQIAK